VARLDVPSSGMTNRKPLVAVCGVLAAAFVILAVLYFTRTAADLPAFLPGHEANSTKHHIKHGIAMIGLAALSLVGAWMLTGPQKSTAA
jgi:hypothetical protein